MGVPQGGIISPLLSNLILHEFDIYMEARIRERIDFSNGEPVTLVNPQYTRWNSKVPLKSCLFCPPFPLLFHKYIYIFIVFNIYIMYLYNKYQYIYWKRENEKWGAASLGKKKGWPSSSDYCPLTSKSNQILHP